MGTELTTLKPNLPSLPAFVDRLSELLSEEWQNGRKVWTLPAALVPTAAQRQAIEAHLSALERATVEVPTNSAEAAAATLGLLAKMLLALGGRRDAAEVEAKGEAYAIALDDLPSWAVAAAVRRWYRGDCAHVAPEGPRGSRHNYDYPPMPAVLQRLARFELNATARGPMLQLRRLLEAEAKVEYSQQHRETMKAKFAELLAWLGRPKQAA